MANINPDANWRDSARPIKFFIWDAVSVFPFALFIMHMRWWTFFVSFGVMVFFTILNRFGFSLQVFTRWLRTSIAGRRKFSIPWWMH